MKRSTTTKLSKRDRDAIRDTFRVLGEHREYQEYINYIWTNHGISVTMPRLRGLKNNVTKAEWIRWKMDRDAKADPTKPQGSKYTEDDDLVRSGPPADAEYSIEMDDAEPDNMKRDAEIVAVLNACVDWDKIKRFLTTYEMHRLNLIGQSELAFDVDAVRFCLSDGTGGYNPCTLS